MITAVRNVTHLRRLMARRTMVVVVDVLGDLYYLQLNRAESESLWEQSFAHGHSLMANPDPDGEHLWLRIRPHGSET